MIYAGRRAYWDLTTGLGSIGEGSIEEGDTAASVGGGTLSVPSPSFFIWVMEPSLISVG